MTVKHLNPLPPYPTHSGNLKDCSIFEVSFKENLGQHKQLKHICSLKCYFSLWDFNAFSQQDLVIPITLQKGRHREA